MEPRQRKEATSIAGRAINWLTDKLGITEAPTYTDGYGVERRSEIPFWEGTQGKKLKKIGETALDFTPIVGDVKGLTIDPYRAYKEGGWGAGLKMAGLGLLTLIPGTDFLKTIPLNKIDEFKSLAKKMEVDLSSVSDKKIQKALNDRVERLQTEVKKDKSDRITIFGDKSINQGLTYKNNELVGFVQVDPRYNGWEREGFKIGRIDNLTIDPITKKSRIKDHTIYGLDAALKYSKAHGQKLYSGDLLLTPKATLKQEEKFNYSDTDKVGKLFVTNNDEYAARSDANSNISEILNRIKKWRDDHIDVFEGETELPAFSLPKYFSHTPITRNGQITYLIDPLNKDLLDYISDTPGWYVREILGLKDPSIISHSVYSTLPHPQSFYEKIVNPDDLPSFQDFGILEYKQGGKINEK